jgi:carbon monoxide dehydrogenase subunit G
MSIEIHLCEQYAAPPAEVWTAIADVTRHVDWMADAERITIRSEQTTGVGTEFECLTKVGPLHTVDVMRVTEWEPAATMGIEHTGTVSGTGRFTLAADGPGTRFCWDERLTFPWWLGGPVGERIGRPVLKRIWRANLRTLGTVVDGALTTDAREDPT